MTKTDLADPERTKAWTKYFVDQGLEVVALDTRGHKTPQIMTKAARKVLDDKWAALEIEKGVKDKPPAFVAGIPETLVSRRC